MTKFARYFFIFLSLAGFCQAVQAQSIPTAVVVFGEKVWFKDDRGLASACVDSLKSAIKRCIDAGGKPEGLTDRMPSFRTYRISSDDGSYSSTSFSCEWNISCVFPSREAVPYLIEGQL